MRTEVFIKIQCASFGGFIVWLVHDQWKKRQNLYELILFRDLCHPLSDENSQADPTLQFSVNWRKVSILRFLWNLSQNPPRLAWWSGPQSEDSLNMPVMTSDHSIANLEDFWMRYPFLSDKTVQVMSRHFSSDLMQMRKKSRSTIGLWFQWFRIQSEVTFHLTAGMMLQQSWNHHLRSI